jgi:imidazolonepropionase-like amidohydrolase
MRMCLLLACLLLSFQHADASDLVLIHARVYPSPGQQPLNDATIVLHDGRIASISTSTRVQPPPGAAVIDCSGLTVTAGLWNSHVHLLPVDLLHADQKTGPQLTVALQQMLTRWGFTSVFDVASTLANAENIRSRIASGEVLGPRILTVGEPFFPQHGIPIYVSGYLEQNHITLPDDATTSDAVQRVRRQIHAGADGIKIFAGSIEADNVLVCPLERARAIVKEAHRLHRPVFAHPTNLAGLNVALDSGVDMLAHVTTAVDENWSPGLIQRMLAAHMAVIPTLTLFDVEMKKAGASPDFTKSFIAGGVARLRAFNAAGGEILFGTDVGYIYQFDTAEEYTLMQSAGMSFDQILASLTTNPAHRFGFAAHSGRIATGMDADVTVFAGDPASDITAFSRVCFTIRQGKIIFQAPPAPTQPPAPN